MLNKNKETSRRRNESGVASLLVVSVLAVVLGLVSIGFARLMDRELRSSLDNELAAQAFYSAQAGLNDARAYLAAGGGALSGCSDWQSTNPGSSYFVSSLSGSTGTAKYSCVSITNKPNELIYTIKAGHSVTFKLNQSNLGNLYFGWENQSYTAGPQPMGIASAGSCQALGLGNLPQDSTLCADATGLLQVGLYPVPNGASSTNNDALAALSRTYFMYPNGGSGAPGTVAYGSGGYIPSRGPQGNNGLFVSGNCKNPNANPVTNNSEAAPRYCNSYISGLQGSSNTYYVRLTAVYQPLIVTVQSTTNGSSGDPLSFSNVQAVVDVTGRGSDVLQRIRARIDLSNVYQDPSFGVQSMVAICKGFRVFVTNPGTYGSAYIDSNNVDNSDGACAAPSGFGSIGGTSGDSGPHTSAPPPAAAVKMVSIKHDYNNSKGNGELTLTGTVNDSSTAGTKAWFQSVECGAVGAFPTSQQNVPVNNSNNTISAYIFPWTFFYCGFHSTMSFVICANIPSVGTNCSSPLSTTGPL